MTGLALSVVIPTRNRPGSIAETVSALKHQDLPSSGYEIVVVDDGSVPPVVLDQKEAGPKLTVIRRSNGERSTARNAGAAAARGEIILFVDDDIAVGSDFLSRHLNAHCRWPGALIVGSVALPNEGTPKPFLRFRKRLEQNGLPETEGPTAVPNFCTAANMSIARDDFQAIGGFDSTIVSSEDQDFAFRHRRCGGSIVFLPKAAAIHRDTALTIRTYCRRVEWGSRQLIPFCRRYPEWRDNIEREMVNGALRWGSEPITQSLRKAAKMAMYLRPCRETMFLLAASLEQVAPNGKALDRLYRALIGVHIFRGYRQGMTDNRADIRLAPATETASVD
jgi:glycosyltransferase involved in cell wall biosynthesis